MTLMRSPVFWAVDNANLADVNAGLRKDVQTLEDNYLSWKQHAQRVEGQLLNVKQIVKQWQDEAIDNGAHSYVANRLFKVVNGRTVREYLGEEEMEAQLEYARQIARKSYGLDAK